MTQTTLRRGSIYSYTELINGVLDAAGDAPITDEESEEIASDIISDVNSRLPGSLVWYPHTSEVWADVDEKTDITDAEFKELLDSAFWASFAKHGW